MKRPAAQRLAELRRVEARHAATLDRARDRLKKAHARGDLARIADAERSVDRVRGFWARANLRRRRLEAMVQERDRLVAMADGVAAGAAVVEKKWNRARKAEARTVKAKAKKIQARLDRPHQQPAFRRTKENHHRNRKGKPVPYVAPEENRLPVPLVIPVSDAPELVPGQVAESPARAFIRRMRPWERAAAKAGGPPQQWTAIWVGDRLVEAFRVLRRFPSRTRPKEFGTAWPAHRYDAGDRSGQVLTGTARVALERPPTGVSADEMARMEEAISWPLQFLREDPEAGKLVCHWAYRVAKECHRTILPEQFGISRSAAWRARDRGLETIARGLIAAGSPVA